MSEGVDIFVCPECKEEHETFDDMMACYQDHL